MNIPDFRNRSPEEILSDKNHYESSGRVFKALSWLDLANRTRTVSALEYAALETRLATEQLVFEELIVGVGTTLDQKDYKKCKGDIDEMTKVINRLIPQYEKLVDFTKAMMKTDFPVTKWDNRKLNFYRGKVSQYLHWSGGLDETVQSEKWFQRGLEIVGEAANYMWHGLTSGNTAVMNLKILEPEMLELWNLFLTYQITLETAVLRADILEPLLLARLKNR
jgi:hypothetical protein